MPSQCQGKTKMSFLHPSQEWWLQNPKNKHVTLDNDIGFVYLLHIMLTHWLIPKKLVLQQSYFFKASRGNS